MSSVQVLARMPTMLGLILNAATVTAAVLGALLLLLLTRVIVRFAADPARDARRPDARHPPPGGRDL